MRSVEEVRLVERLVADGLSDYAIARETGVPRSTVSNWRHGRTPQRRRDQASPTCEACGNACLPLPPDREQAYAYLLGQYLGDGAITTHPRGVFRLTVYGDAQYVDITSEVMDAMRVVLPGNLVNSHQHGTGRCVAIYMYSRSWPCLFPQHGPGHKHTREIRLRDWQLAITRRFPEALLRGLIHSDGCRSMNPIRKNGTLYRYSRYTFSNVSSDIRGIFSDHLDLLGIPWRRMNAVNISVARREAVARLDEFVGPKT
jgi:hypothetical protein